MNDYIDIVFTDPPGPESQFVEVEDKDGVSCSVGEWIQDGYWRLRIPDPRKLANLEAALEVEALAKVVFEARNPAHSWDGPIRSDQDSWARVEIHYAYEQARAIRRAVGLEPC